MIAHTCSSRGRLIAAGIAALVVATACLQRDSNNSLVSKLSPDGSMVLVADINRSQEDAAKYLCIKIDIRDGAGNVLYQDQTGASARLRWEIEWVGNDRVHLDSSDIGDMYWERGPDGQWKRVD